MQVTIDARKLRVYAALVIMAGMLLPQRACNIETWTDIETTLAKTVNVVSAPERLLWKVRPTYYHAEPSQTDERYWETADGSNVNDFYFRDTIYIAVPQNRWYLRKYKNCYIGDMPCKIVDKLNKRYNRHNRIDILLPNKQKLSTSDSTLVELW